MTVRAYDKVTVQGQTLDNYTYAAFQVAQGMGPNDDDWTIIKGSYKPDDASSPSSGTHAGGGALDISSFNHEQRVRQLRACGFAAWFRVAIPGLWEEHIHCELIGNVKASPSAKAQWKDYINYLSGLVGSAPDDTWHPFPKGGPPLVFRWGKYQAENRRVEALRSSLNHAGKDIGKAIRNAQNDAQADTLRAQSKALDNMNARFRYQPELYVVTRGKG